MSRNFCSFLCELFSAGEKRGGKRPEGKTANVCVSAGRCGPLARTDMTLLGEYTHTASSRLPGGTC